MITFTSILLAFSGATTLLAEPLPNLNPRALASTPNSQGTHDGFFYTFWNDNERGSSINYTNEAGGKYSVEWSNTGNFIGGKGRAPGSTTKPISYTGTWNASAGNSYVALYGWFEDPLVEYYIVESHGTYDPDSNFAKPKEVIEVDGGTYHIHVMTRTTAWTAMLQLWSVRQEKRVGGTISVKEHFDAWARAGAGARMGGNHTYQVLAVEAYRYKDYGSASITVKEP